MKLKSPEYKRMNPILRKRLSLCLGKTIFSIFLFTILSPLMISVSMVPVMQERSVRNMFITAVVLFCALTVVFTVISGLVGKATKIIRHASPWENVLFSGFDDKRNVKAGLFYAFLFCVSGLILLLIIKFSGNVFTSMIPSKIDFGNEKEFVKFVRSATIFSTMLIIIFVILVLPFIFAWNVLIDYKEISAAKAILRSASLLGPKYFQFIGYVFYSVFKNIIMIIFVTALDIAVLSRFKLSFLSLVFSFYAILQQYTIYSKILFCIPIYYYSLLSVNEILPESCNESSSQ